MNTDEYVNAMKNAEQADIDWQFANRTIWDENNRVVS
jgi:hypothetical protein